MKKFYLTFLTLVLISLDAYSFSDGTSQVQQSVIINGISFGTVIAAITSWTRNRSVLLMVIHGIFSWFYVLYFVLTRKKSERR
ncbi:hypothetical protein LDL76_00325 [Salegentibacter mishustinae]|uniref:hypothetical protein n=1 Tax=Salegentibacter mishustinae TaxID=270918 RepID=UPI0007C6F07A|nr:hypothetical protein [Salegentibacter mishustinae]PZX67315.1 hypothetical protein LY54_00044 [Salegentibacter mishustinae]UBZ07173.1 hypothetical protein LDL76_00325 [Salegentibacter mishustinae]GGW80551.1 hypothetical protein GCM10008086_05550 [Salegentibacter mishustinae]